VISVRLPVLRSDPTGVIHATGAGMIAQKGRRSDQVLPNNSSYVNEKARCI
jgi:hypothetical protein